MQWFVKTTLVVDGKVAEAAIDVAPLLVHLHGLTDAELREHFPGGSETPPGVVPQPRKIVVTGWHPGGHQKIHVIKSVREWTGLDLHKAKLLVDELDFGKGSFSLDYEPQSFSRINREALLMDLSAAGAVCEVK